MGEEYFEELREAQGFDDAMIEVEREEVARLLEPSYIWPENWTAAQVFVDCRWEKQVVVGLKEARTFFLGIAATEVMAVARARRVPREEWTYVLSAVRIMEKAALTKLNAASE